MLTFSGEIQCFKAMNVDDHIDYCFIVPVPREEWEQESTEPSETYEQYLDSIRNREGFILCMPCSSLAMKSEPNNSNTPNPSAKPVNSPTNSTTKLSHDEMANRLGQAMLDSIKKKPPVH